MTSERMIMVPDWLVEEAASLIEQAGMSGTGVSLTAPRLRAALAQPAAGEPEQQTAINADDLPTKKYPLGAFDFDAPVAVGEPVYQYRNWRNQQWIDTDQAGLRAANESGWDTRTLWTASTAAAHGESASEQHRNQMADTIVSLRTEMAALRRNAAAHGDEAVRKDAERYRALRNTPEIFIGVAEGDDMVFLKSPDQLDQLADNAAAMRAQAGEGESA